MSKLARVQPADILSSSRSSVGINSSSIGLISSSRLQPAAAAGQQSQIISKLSGQKKSIVSSKLLKGQPLSTKKLAPSSVTGQKVIAKNIATSGDSKVKDRLLDAIYFICPDCSCVQCSAIIAGLLTVAMLTLLFLYLGHYWDPTKEDEIITPINRTY